MSEVSSTEQKLRSMTLGVFVIKAQTSWSSAALIFEDRTGGMAPRRATVTIDRPSDLAYIRERLDDIETAWRKELDAIKVAT